MNRVRHTHPTGGLTPVQQIHFAREVISLEAQALEIISTRLDTEFCRAADLLYRCSGNVIVSGIGKAGIIAQKLSATLASTGTTSHYLHPAEAIHGDLGRIHRNDVMIMLSQSGETEEITRLLTSIKNLQVPLIAMTSRRTSTLGKAANITLEMGPLREACHLGVAPSTSTTAMLALGDALALVVSRMRDFAKDDFYVYHPGGALGRKLAKVQDVMRPINECRVSRCSQSVRQVLGTGVMPRRRTGAVMIVDPNGILRGIFTDSDLARLFETRQDQLLDQPIRNCMTKRPLSVVHGSLLNDALELLATRKISELPVVDEQGVPVGMIDITDVLGLFPDPTRLQSPARLCSASADSMSAETINTPLPIQLATTAEVRDESLQGIVGSQNIVSSTPAIPRPNAAAFFTSRTEVIRE